MPSADFLAQFGIFFRHRFLSDDLCSRVVAGIRSGIAQEATVGNDDGVYDVDTSTRRVSLVEVSEAIRDLVRTPLTELKPAIENHFRRKLSHYQTPCFLSYETGDHYVPHRDQRRDEGATSWSWEREVSVVVFLNDPAEVEANDCYGGGKLTFFGLMKAPGLEARGLPLDAEKGLLVAFPSDLIHQVTPVTHGERFTMVTWYASSEKRVPADLVVESK